MKYNLSEITEVIRQRRSISPEQFSTRKVQRDQIELILNNALWAPNHGSTQPWRFKVFYDEGLKRLGAFIPELYKQLTPAEQFKQGKYDKLAQRFQHVSVVVAICMHRDDSGKIKELEEIEAVACAVQNMYLTCTAYGMGGFWSTPGFVYSQQMNTFLNLREQDRCLGLFYIGYPKEEWPTSYRKPLEYVTEWIETPDR
jgi:nitroreductase